MRNLFFLTLLIGSIAGCATTPAAPMNAEERLNQAQTVTTNWYTYSEAMAMKIIAEYGPPDRIEPDRLTWYNKSPWDQIAVWDREDYYYSGTVGPDNLEQTLLHAVPADKRKALAAFSKKLAVSKDGRQLSVRGNSEALDFLALNLAHEIIRGTRDPAEARSFYGRTERLSQAGKSSPYLEGLLFLKQSGATSPKF